MGHFSYSGYNADGQSAEGAIEAASEDLAYAALRHKGILPTRLTSLAGPPKVKWWAREITLTTPSSRGDLQRFTRSLATLLAAQLPLTRALGITAESLRKGAMKSACLRIMERIESGSGVVEALRGEAKLFPDFYLAMVRAGEVTARLDQAFLELANYLESAEKTRRKITSALIYPAIVLTAALAVLSIILFVLVPALSPMFQSANIQVPTTLSILMSLRDGLTENGFVVALGGLLLIGAFVVLKRQAAVQQVWEAFYFRLPFVGRLRADLESARLARTLGLFLKSGMDGLSALKETQRLVRTEAFRQNLIKAEEAVRAGRGMEAALSDNPQLNLVVRQFLKIGEEAARLPEMLIQSAELCQASVQTRLDRLVQLLPSLLTLVMGSAIGFLIFALMDAIMSLNDVAF